MTEIFADKVALITGAGSGIGRATAIKLASQGARLAICDINHEGMESYQKELSNGRANHVISYRLDVRSSGACKATVDSVVSTMGKIDFLFNCAGVNPIPYQLEDTTDEYWDKIIDTNLKGVYYMTRACIPHLKSGAAIVNVSSICGLRANARIAIYNAAKFGVTGFTQSMALELGPKGIRVNAVAPGQIHTPTNMNVVVGQDAMDQAKTRIALGRMGTPEEVADVVSFLFSEESRYVNGSVLEISGAMGS